MDWLARIKRRFKVKPKKDTWVCKDCAFTAEHPLHLNEPCKNGLMHNLYLVKGKR